MSEPHVAAGANDAPSPGSPSASPPSPPEGRGARRKPPRWTIPFLRALERTGNARASAQEAGVDHTTAYNRRKAHAGFAADWEWVLKAYAERVEREKAEEAERLAPSPHSRLASGESDLSPPGRGESGEELVASGSQLKRAGAERWSRRKQEAFLAELAVTANLRVASKAVGISYEAVRKRRRKDPHLAAACKAAIEACRARIPEFLAGAAAATFDPDAVTDGETNPLPKVTVAEAIRIAQLHGGTKQQPASALDDESYSYEEDVADIRERLVRKLQAVRRRDRPQLLERGWSYDESWDRDIPPGWTKGPHWRPMESGDEE